MRDRGDLILTKPIKIQKKQKKEPKGEQGDPLFTDSGRASSEIPEWLQEFRENLVDDEIPEHGDSHARSSHEAALEPTCKRRGFGEGMTRRSTLSLFGPEPHVVRQVSALLSKGVQV